MTADVGEPPRLHGRPLEVAPGETLAQALTRRGLALRGRSIRYHRPRAPFCGIGACSQCLVRVNGQPNVRACRFTPGGGDAITVENGWPSAPIDLLSALDLLFYRGIDTLHGFRWPRFATPLYHRVVRRLAGFGRLAVASAGQRAGAASVVDTEIVVVGGGVSGRACVDRLTAAGRAAHLVDRSVPVTSPPSANTWPGYTVDFLPPPSASESRRFTLLATREDGSGLLLRSSNVVVASGGFDANLVFDGNDRPGVMTADGAEAFSGPTGSPPFRQAVLFGGEERVGEILERFGAHVEAVVAPGPIVPSVAERAARLEVPLYPRTLLLGAGGRSRVRTVHLRPRGEGQPFDLAADAIVLAHRRLPASQLFFQAGARTEWRAGPAAYYPVLTSSVETSVPGLYAAGEAAGFVGRAGAVRSGEATADLLLGRTPADPGPRVEADRPGEMWGYLREIRPSLLRRRRPVICPCEDVLLSEVEDAHQAGYRGMEVVKRYTGVGTGLCQGRYCLPDTLLWLSILEDRPPADVGYITQRPPVHPAPLDALAAMPLPDPEAP
ncbi:MAG TPA: 2Fe-2S iron-sulfur cluster-binding protein [Thermoplasmata archaeon]|nr:2Fe-2S iron-sulfur cluster-binding protein [Thermoplasmata archaeon]